ncbi:MAG: hypothetical protein FWB80_12555 [Defluviitaleaceae bacterium]|nr:hypothetical protein [Defluviitaleaceae bacterium]
MLLPEMRCKLVKVLREGVSEKGRPWAIVTIMDDDDEQVDLMLNTESSIPIKELARKSFYMMAVEIQNAVKGINGTVAIRKLSKAL